MLWDSNLAHNVLEELLHNPRFSMYGIHAKKIADVIAKEMSFQNTTSYDETQENGSNINNAHQYDNVGGTGTVEQFALPSPQRPVTMQQQKKISQNNYGTVQSGNIYEKNAKSSSQNKQNQNQPNKQNKQNQQQNQHQGSIYNNNYNNNYNQQQQQQQMTDHERYYHEQQKQNQQHNKPEPIPEEQDEPQDYVDPDDDDEDKPGHKNSASVVQHELPMDHIRASEINDYGGGGQQRYSSYEPDDDEDSNEESSDHDQYHQHLSLHANTKS
eukprot:115747_1